MGLFHVLQLRIQTDVVLLIQFHFKHEILHGKIMEDKDNQVTSTAENSITHKNNMLEWHLILVNKEMQKFLGPLSC